GRVARLSATPCRQASSQPPAWFAELRGGSGRNARFQDPLGLVTQQAPETHRVVKLVQRLEIRGAALERAQVHLERHVAGDFRQLPREKRGFAMVAQLSYNESGVAHLQFQHAPEIVVE